MEHPKISHPDVIEKALALLVMFVLAVLTFFLAAGLPDRTRVPDNRTFNVLGAGGGRFYSFLPGDDGPVVALGLDYLAPRGWPENNASRVSLESIRDKGMLKAYALPPVKLAFTPDGRPVVLPEPLVATGPRGPEAIEHGNRARPRVALTFDTSDVRESCASVIIDIMTQLKAPATFFVCGGWCYANPGLLREAVGRGFEIANHSFSHPWFTRLPPGQIVSEIRRTEAAVQEVGGTRIAAYFRPPFGDVDARVLQVTGQLGYLTVMWSSDTLDWHRATTPEQLVERAAVSVRNGDIVLMHTHGRDTALMLPEIVRRLRARGFELTTVSGVLQP